jgi:hypothetical protein
MFCGHSEDAIEYYTAEIKNSEDAIKQFHHEIHKTETETYGFASFAAVPHAHVIARILENKHPKGTTITLASNPEDIVGIPNLCLISHLSTHSVGCCRYGGT